MQILCHHHCGTHSLKACFFIWLNFIDVILLIEVLSAACIHVSIYGDCVLCQNIYTAYERDLFLSLPPPHFLLSLFVACVSWKKTSEHCRRIACLFIWGYLCCERHFEGVCLRSSSSLSKHSFRAGWAFTASKTLRCHHYCGARSAGDFKALADDCLISSRRHQCFPFPHSRLLMCNYS